MVVGSYALRCILPLLGSKKELAKGFRIMFLKGTVSSSLMIVLACTLGNAPMLRADGATSSTVPVHWVLVPGAEPNCSSLNAGVTSVTGDGTEHVTVKLKAKSGGGGTMEVKSTAYGTAVDNNGNQYSWAYVNHLSFDINTNVGHYTDRFDLVSHGSAPNLTVYLNWDVIIDPNHPPQELSFFATLVSATTTKGAPFCDPI